MPSSFLTSWRQMNRTRPAVTNADTNLVKNKIYFPSRVPNTTIFVYLTYYTLSTLLHEYSTVQHSRKNPSKYDVLLQWGNDNGRKPFIFPYHWHLCFKGLWLSLEPSSTTHPSLAWSSLPHTHSPFIKLVNLTEVHVAGGPHVLIHKVQGSMSNKLVEMMVVLFLHTDTHTTTIQYARCNKQYFKSHLWQQITLLLLETLRIRKSQKEHPSWWPKSHLKKVKLKTGKSIIWTSESPFNS